MHRILVCTDGSKEAVAAQGFLAALSLPPGTAVHLLTVVPEHLNGKAADRQALGEGRSPTWVRARPAIQEGCEALARCGAELTWEVRAGEPTSAILATAQEWNASLIVVGSHARTGVASFVQGSVARCVADHARCPVLVARAPAHGVRRVLLALDESDHAAVAADFTTRLPLHRDTEVILAHVARSSRIAIAPHGRFARRLGEHVREVRSACRERAERLFAPSCLLLSAAGHRVSTALMEGDPSEQILRLAAKCEADLIIAGARSVSPVRSLRGGSVADHLLHSLACSVLIVH